MECTTFHADCCMGCRHPLLDAGNWPGAIALWFIYTKLLWHSSHLQRQYECGCPTSCAMCSICWLQESSVLVQLCRSFNLHRMPCTGSSAPCTARAAPLYCKSSTFLPLGLAAVSSLKPPELTITLPCEDSSGRTFQAVDNAKAFVIMMNLLQSVCLLDANDVCTLAFKAGLANCSEASWQHWYRNQQHRCTL